MKRGEEVRVADNFSTGKRENLTPFLERIELVEGDIRSYHIVREVVQGVDYVLHQGGLPSVPRSINDPITTNEVNVGGTLNILDASRDAGVKRVVYASSSSVYGANKELPKREDMAPQPISPYAVAKLTTATCSRGPTGWRRWPCAISMCLGRGRIPNPSTRRSFRNSSWV